MRRSRPPRPCGTTASRYETYPIDTGRLRRVVELAAEKAGWGRQLPQGSRPRHRGASQLRELRRDGRRGRGRRQGQLTVPRVDTAIDCGFVANPERIRSQIEGAAVMGLCARQIRRDHASRTDASSRATSTTSRSSASTSRRLDKCVHIVRARHRRAVERRRRAGRAAVRAGALQRDLRRDRQAHPPPADRGTNSNLRRSKPSNMRRTSGGVSRCPRTRRPIKLPPTLLGPPSAGFPILRRVSCPH